MGIYHLNKDWKKEKRCQLQQVRVKVKYLSKSWLFYCHRREHRSYWDCKWTDVRIRKMKQKITTQNIHLLILQLLMKSHKSIFRHILKIQNLQHQMLLLISTSCFYWNSVIERFTSCCGYGGKFYANGPQMCQMIQFLSQKQGEYSKTRC